VREVFYFGLVGITATATHYLVAISLVALAELGILTANFLAYCSAVGVSYVGHTKITFQTNISSKSLLKFCVVSLAALAMSQGLLAGLSALNWFDYKINMLFTVAFVPCVSYLLNKFWVYKNASQVAK